MARKLEWALSSREMFPLEKWLPEYLLESIVIVFWIDRLIFTMEGPWHSGIELRKL